MNNPPQHIILFDGVCNLCNNSIQFVIKHDKRRLFRFASLQSEIGQKLMSQHHLSSATTDSIVYIENNQAYIQSAAALRISKHLNGIYPLLYCFIVVPPFIRNAVYNLIAKNRYKWFGKRESCMVPTPELKELFLD